MQPRSLCDRFIPVRQPRDSAFELNHSAGKKTEASTNYSRILSPQSSKYLKFATASTDRFQTLNDFIFKSISSKKQMLRKQQTRKAMKILDAPGVINNFYYNPLDWSRNNLVGIALSQSAYLLNSSKQIVEIDRYSHIPITCLRFHQGGQLCMLGESTGRIEIYDTEKSRRVRQLNVHYDRVGVLQDGQLAETVLSGSKDKLIKLNDLRIRKSDVFTFDKHRGQICGMAGSQHYLASGGNDNRVMIWDLRKNSPINQLKQHKSAVKALSWCPWKNSLLATGGGNNDKRIMLWNGNKNMVESKLDTHSQVIALEWKQEGKQLISGHYSGKSGYCLVWEGSNIVLKLKGHHGRLLGMKLNPSNKDELITIAADQTLRFWDLSQERPASGNNPINLRKQNKFSVCDFR